MYNTIKNIDFSNELINWFNKNKRKLPWRNTKDPYKIWLSEVMLQQTKVETVIPYYNKWIIKFPTIEDVAKSKTDLLLKYCEKIFVEFDCKKEHYFLLNEFKFPKYK